MGGLPVNYGVSQDVSARTAPRIAVTTFYFVDNNKPSWRGFSLSNSLFIKV